MTKNTYGYLFFFGMMQVALFLQGIRLFSFFGAAANLMLVVSLFTVFFIARAERFSRFFPFLALMGILAILWFPFWIFPILLFVACASIVLLARRLLTGNAYIDFYICLLVTGILFFAGNAAMREGQHSFVMLLKEMGINSIVSAPLLVAYAVCSRFLSRYSHGFVVKR